MVYIPKCRFEDLLRALTVEKADICEAMAFALDNAECAFEVGREMFRTLICFPLLGPLGISLGCRALASMSYTQNSPQRGSNFLPNARWMLEYATDNVTTTDVPTRGPFGVFKRSTANMMLQTDYVRLRGCIVGLGVLLCCHTYSGLSMSCMHHGHALMSLRAFIIYIFSNLHGMQTLCIFLILPVLAPLSNLPAI